MIPRWLKYVAILNIMMYISDDEHCGFCWLCGLKRISKELSSYACTNTVQSGQQFRSRLQRVLTELWNSNTYNHSPLSGNYHTVAKSYLRCPTVVQVPELKNFPAFYESLNFITVFKTAWKRSMLHSPKLLSFTFILILSAYLQEIFKVASDIQVLRPKLHLSHAYHIPSHSIPLKTRRELFYLKTQLVPRSKHFSSRI